MTKQLPAPQRKVGMKADDRLENLEPIQAGEMVFLSGMRKGKPVMYTYADADKEAERRRKISIARRKHS